MCIAQRHTTPEVTETDCRNELYTDEQSGARLVLASTKARRLPSQPGNLPGIQRLKLRRVDGFGPSLRPRTAFSASERGTLGNRLPESERQTDVNTIPTKELRRNPAGMGEESHSERPARRWKSGPKRRPASHFRVGGMQSDNGRG